MKGYAYINFLDKEEIILLENDIILKKESISKEE